jgi:hypothetical protein
MANNLHKFEFQSDIPAMNDELRRTFDRLTGNDTLDSVLIENTTINGSGDTFIEHKLGRAARGFYLVNADMATILWEDSSKSTTNLLCLNAATAGGADATVSLVIF